VTIQKSRWSVVRYVLIGAVLFFSIAYVVQNVEWDALINALETMDIAWIVVGLLTTLLAHLIRAWRWRLLIPSGEAISLWSVFSATIIGYFMNGLIPRSGELVRPWALARSQGRATSEMVGTVVVERIIDGLSLLLLLIFLLVLQSERFTAVFVGHSPRTAMIAIAVPLAAALVVMWIVVRTTAGDRLMGSIERRLPGRMQGRLRRVAGNFRNGLAAVGRAGRWKIAASSLLIWLGYAAALECAIIAFGLEVRPGLTPGDAFTLLAITSIGITIAPTPGAFGVYHFFCKEALTRLFAVPDERAVAFALVTHAAPYLAITTLGAILLVRENISLREVQQSRTN